MRRSLILLLSTGLVGMSIGCSRTMQHTAGVWDCDPPDVNTVLTPYAGITPASTAPVPPIVATPLNPQTAVPQTAEPLKTAPTPTKAPAPSK